MKRILFFVCTLLCVNVLLSQEFLVGGVQYTVNQGTNTVTATGNNKNTLPQFLTIPETVENNGTTYTVTAIGNDAFKESNNNYHLASVVIPNTVTSIGDKAFYFCRNLYSVTIGSNVTSIGEYAFYYCTALPTVNFPNSLTSIAGRAFYYCTSLISVTIPSNVTYIGISAFNYCSSLASVTFLPETAPEVNSYVFSSTPSGKKLTVPFGSDYSSWETTSIWSKIYYKINQGEIKTLNNTFEITPENKRTILNQGVLRITQNGQLINTTSENVSGVYEIETPTLPTDKWSFVGAPFNGYKLEAIKEGTNDVSVSLFDYGTGTWSTGWATVEDQVGAGEGYFLWSFAAEPTIFTTDSETQDDHYTLNNDVVTVEKNLTTHQEGGNWMALANPYTFKLDIQKFLSAQTGVQGGVYYRLTYNASNQPVWETASSGELNLTEGFFVNFANPGDNTATFNKDQRFTGSKKIAEERNFIHLTMTEGANKSELLFAQNEEAKQEYDIFDANKMFSPAEVSEPYFVTEGNALVKEEVQSLPYTANLNIRNYENKEVTISIDNIPEGVNVFLLDNGQDIKMNGGVEYTTTITAGENADRFQLLVKKQQRIERVKDNQITIKNNNRQITITSDITNLNIEVYNNLGQKVFATKDYNFTLDQVPAGSYVVKAFYERVNESQKIIIE
ncbi:MAG: leucine-rich repeat domain-containing protein [Bacteroidales bacterium]|nr:leucine-rich repeat domain-containing protein [Bacteroidales bacterium]